MIGRTIELELPVVQAMDRAYIDKHNLIERYLLGKLSEEEACAFEDCFVFDAQLRKEIDLAEKVISSVQRRCRTPQQAAAHSEQMPAPPRRRDLRWAAALVSAALLPYLYFTTQVSEPFELTSEIPSASEPVVPLERTRGQDSIPLTSAAIPQGSDAKVVLRIPIRRTDSSELELSLTRSDAGGEAIWSGNWSSTGLRSGYLYLTIRSSYLPPGSYDLTVDTEIYRFRAYPGDLGLTEDN